MDALRIDDESTHGDSEGPAAGELPARFQRLYTLGRGGMGVVHAAYDGERRMPVAVKHLYRVDGTRVYRFKREFRALSDISHANIVQLYELVSAGDQWYLTMEIVDGLDFITYVRGFEPAPKRPLASPSPMLPVWGGASQGDASGRGLTRTSIWSGTQATGDARTLERDATQEVTAQTVGLYDHTLSFDHANAPAIGGDTNATGGQVPAGSDGAGVPIPRDITEVLDVGRARSAFAQLASALETLHRANVIHRDLKPSNVMVTDAGRVVLMDFGMVAELRMAMGERTGAVMGTPLYMAPEQARGETITPAADWYAFGVMLYEALAGRTPQRGSALQIIETKHSFERIPPSEYVFGVPSDLEDLCLELLAPRPEDRPTGAEVCERLGPGAVYGIRRPMRRRRAKRPSVSFDMDEIFVGREAELALLENTFEEVLGGAARTVLVRGLSGMGKTRLVHHFANQATVRAQRAGQPMPLLLSGRCHEWESLPYKAFDGVVDELCLHLLDMDDDERRKMLPEDMSALARLFPVLYNLPEVDRKPLSIDPRVLKARAQKAMRRLLRALAQWRPLLILVEDFHWSDSDSQEVLASIMRPPAVGRIMVVISVRAEDEHEQRVRAIYAQLARHTELATIELSPLDQSEEDALIAAVMDRVETERDSLEADEAERELLDACAGHPLLLREILRFMVSGERGGVFLTPEERSMETLIWRRVRVLDQSTRALVAVAGLAGEPTPLWMLSEVAELDPVDRERALLDARQRHLLRITRTRPEPWIDVFHDKVREAVNQHTNPAEARAQHARLGRIMVREDMPPARIAAHFLAAGEHMSAARYFLVAAEVACDALAFAGAFRFYQQALDALAAADDACSNSPDCGEATDIGRLRVRIRLAWASTVRAMDGGDGAMVQLDLAEPEAEALGMLEELSDLHYLRGSLLFPRGDIVGCQREHEQARTLARRAGSVASEVRALSGLGDAHYLGGAMFSAQEYYAESLSLCRAHDLNENVAANLAMLGLARLFAGDPRRGFEECKEALDLAQEAEDIRSECLVLVGSISVVQVELGDVEGGIAGYLRGLEMARTLESWRFEIGGLTYLGGAYLHMRRFDECAAVIEEAMATRYDKTMTFVGPILMAMRACITDDPKVRAKSLAWGKELLASGTPSHSFLYYHRYAMETGLATGDHVLAERSIAALDAYLRERPGDWRDLWIDRGRATLALQSSGGDDESLTGARDVEARARKRGYTMEAAILRRAIDEHT